MIDCARTHDTLYISKTGAEDQCSALEETALSYSALRPLNDRDETNDRYTTSLIQRQEQASAFAHTHLRDYSRPSSSSGSAHSGHSLRRTPRFEARPSRLRSSSVDSPKRESEPESRAPRDRPSQRRLASAHYPYAGYKHPVLRLSNRTKSAVTWALEEGLRKGPNEFTPFLPEENAQMSEIGGGRATNGGARTGGPVPVSSSGTPSGMRTPRQIMNDRAAREQQRQESQKADEQRRLTEERRLAEERRRSAERRAAAVGGGAPRVSQASSQYSPDPAMLQGQYNDRYSSGGQVAGSDVLGNPTSRSTQGYSDGRQARVSSSSQQEPRPAQASSGATRRTQQAPRQPTVAGTSTGPPSHQPQTDGAQQRSGASSFPHAFERWETLSSHWEGLTSYWLHKLEQNTEEIRETVPNAVTLNRQITDLSAAGANLFHAVVELQRLRASSERKFQRWFFESKANEERLRETHGQLENQLKLERGSREDAARLRADASIQAENAKREVAEMRRELMISKDEARRAWEELGRRNQDSLETAQSLKDGRITLVGGVQVVPYFGGPSRTGSASQRPTTRDGQPQYGSTGMASAAGAAGLQSPGDERDYYQQEASPTNTDPFMETSKRLHHEPGQPSLAAGTYQPYGGTPTSTKTAQTAIPPGQRASSGSRAPQSTSIPVSAQDAQRFYQHAPQEAFLHSPQSSSQAIPQQPATAPRDEVRSEGSYVESELEPEYLIDASGNYRLDSAGHPIPIRRQDDIEEDDSYDTEADIRREQEHAARYGVGAGMGGMVPPEASSVPATSAQAMASFESTSQPSGSGRPDYEGAGYSGWEALRGTSHHHPTRLSDVLEEEEERSSRRTGE
ncbi:hypothetical protein LTR37_010440 [Vermiconidia calcicola]|uniref:Uncharacterized protein n=1 Tax=Vermiconidia calcicola TaxID=1690605 RepID=A0ACC3N543_9PEZI|nr:hypothetical protein LTR37_010440 [Vermiconidia calcicola]